MSINKKRSLYLIIPCYNEEEVLYKSFRIIKMKMDNLIRKGYIKNDSKIFFVDDGSKDKTWEIIKKIKKESKYVKAIKLSNNFGHQNALVAGLTETLSYADITISLDVDLQDDIDIIEKMIKECDKGSEIVYGVRNDRSTDSFLKRVSANIYYSILKFFGVRIIPNHADYRLMTKKATRSLMDYKEKNLFLRGIVPSLGYRSSIVYYKRKKRLAGKTHYSISKMINLSLNGITSFSVFPIRIVSFLGFIMVIISIIGIVYCMYRYFTGNTITGWTSLGCIIFLVSGVQMLSFGIIGEYIGKTYIETKNRPRYIVDQKI